MRLTPEEYERGVLSWEAEGQMWFKTSTSGDAHVNDTWSDWLSDSSGSRVQSQALQHCRLQARGFPADVINRPFKVRWERTLGKGLHSIIWVNDLNSPPVLLALIPDMGIFHRLVVGIQHLDWGTDFVLRFDRTIVQFITGTVTGESVSPFDSYEISGQQIHLKGGGFGTAEFKGRFIDICAPGSNGDEAEANCHAILGLIMLFAGDSAIGPILFSEAYETKEGRQHGSVAIPVHTPLPFVVPDPDLELMSHGLEFLLGSEHRKRARSLALRWYERGIRSSDGTDMLFCFFVGIEVLVSTFAAQEGPIPEVEARRASVESLLSGFGEEERDLVNWIRQRTAEPSLTQRFRFFVGRAGWEPDVVQEFQELNLLRNQVAHGDKTVLSIEDARRARKLLVRILKSEFGLLGELGWQKEPSMWDLRVEYFLDIPAVKTVE